MQVWNAGPAFWGLLFLATLLNTPEVLADGPALAIRLIGGQSAIYAVTEVERVDFQGDTTLVVVTETGSDDYATELIAKIEFLWDVSGVEGPEGATVLIDAIHLFQNQPNPFSPETQIRFKLPEAAEVELRIYNPSGRLVRTLVSGEQPAGPHMVRWNGLNDLGRKVSSGVYFYSLRAPGIDESRRMILMP